MSPKEGGKTLVRKKCKSLLGKTKQNAKNVLKRKNMQSNFINFV